jgi:hypothetical protein
MEIIATTEHQTIYRCNVEPTDQKSIQLWLGEFINHHKLVGVTLNTIDQIADHSKIWTRSHLKKAMLLMVCYKSEKDSLFVPYFAESVNTPFGCLEVYNYAQLQRWKSFIPGHVISINHFLS